MLNADLLHGPNAVRLDTERVAAATVEHGLAVVLQVDFACRARFAKQGDEDVGVGPSSYYIPSHCHNFVL